MQHAQASDVSRANAVTTKKMQGPSMLRRLIAIQLSAFVIVWLALTALTYHEATKFGSGDFDRQMGMFAEALLKIAAVEPTQERVEHSAKVITDLYVEYGVGFMGEVPGYEVVFQIWSREGTLLTKSKAAPSTRLTRSAQGIVEEQRSGAAWRVVSMTDEGTETTVQIAEPLAVRTKMAMPIFWWFTTPLFWILPLIAAVTWISARAALRPLSRLAQEINARGAASNAPITTGAEHAETRSIVDALNELLRRQGALLKGQREFLADAAHELRTPLAAIAAQTHVLTSSNTKDEFQQGITTLQAGVQRAAALVKQLLAMARLESGASVSQPIDVNMDALVRERVAHFAPEALEKRIDISMEAGDLGLVRIDPFHVQSIVDNALDNAIRYCPSGSRVRVSTAERDETIEIVIADDGPGIPIEARDRALARFGRLNQQGDSEGSGLGLAIAKAAASELSATLELSEGIDGRGLGVVLRWPVAQPSTT